MRFFEDEKNAADDERSATENYLQQQDYHKSRASYCEIKYLDICIKRLADKIILQL